MEKLKIVKNQLYDEKRRIKLNIRLLNKDKIRNFIHLRRFHARLRNVNFLLSTMKDNL